MICVHENGQELSVLARFFFIRLELLSIVRASITPKKKTQIGKIINNVASSHDHKTHVFRRDTESEGPVLEAGDLEPGGMTTKEGLENETNRIIVDAKLGPRDLRHHDELLGSCPIKVIHRNSKLFPDKSFESQTCFKFEVRENHDGGCC